VSKAFWPLLEGHGRIINVSSGGGQLSEPSGWAPAYSLSKTALNGVTVQLALDGQRAGIAVNSICPGWVRTDMGGPGAPRDVAEAADTPVWLALEAPASLSGKFLRDRQEIPW
jgi:NAD(P)-dependent dehydrogenase (short-subunit alcohol dehydrogenase family)